MSPVTFGPTVFPMSPTAEGTQPASAEPGVSSSDVGATRIPLIANNPVWSTSSYECQRNGEQIDPLQTSDPWLSFYSGPGSQQALRDALWGTYGPTTTQLAAMPRTLNLSQSCSHVGDRLQPGGVLTGGQDQLGAPVQQKVGSNLSSRVLCLDKVFLDRTRVDMVLLLVCHLDGIRMRQQ